MGTPPNFRVRAAPGPALGAQTVSARRMGRIRRFRQHKISRKKTGRKDRDLLRQVKNIPKVFQICPWYIVKADCPDVKNYSHLPRREKNARTRLRCGAGPRVHIIYILYVFYTFWGRESSSRIQSSTWTTEYSLSVLRITTRSMPALMIMRRHMEQDVAS